MSQSRIKKSLEIEIGRLEAKLAVVELRRQALVAEIQRIHVALEAVEGS
jgi:hypothetical protein